jgi:hypothetical protein
MFNSNASSAAGGANYIEDVFSTFLYTGNSSTQTITNNIDLSTKGGLVWIKRRTSEAHYLFDTSRGPLVELNTDGTDENQTKANSLTSFNSDGFSLGSFGGSNYSVAPDNSYVSWTFREQPKFFDIVTYTGTGVARTVAHNLGSVPGCIIVKRTDTAGFDWLVYHRSTGNTNRLLLNDTAAAASGTSFWNDTTPTSTVFTVGTNVNGNASGGTYIAYIFAHDAGGFGLTGTDNVVSCGSWTGTGTTPGPVVTLGYEPQWVMWKKSDSGAESWHIRDVMRGMPVTASGKDLYANSSSAEGSTTNEGLIPTATGFQVIGTNTNANASGGTYIYIACRRGPMKVPTLGTTVYNAVARDGTGATATVSTVGFPPDAALITSRNKIGTPTNNMFDRLRGRTLLVSTDATTAEVTDATTVTGFDLMTGVYLGDGSSGRVNYAYGSTFINWFFKRAPSFFDVVCDTGTGAGRTINHNLGVAPQLMIRKRRNSTSNWCVYPNDITQVLFLDATNAFGTNGATYWNSTAPTSTVFSIGTNTDVNTSGGTYVTYLFATCPGVSKVGSYTGTATTKQIECGFTGGARWVMIKRTDSTGDWYVWDSTRGISTSNDPYLLLNSGAAEVTGTDYVDAYAAGFELSSTAPAAINASGGTYIFLAIA